MSNAPALPEAVGHGLVEPHAGLLKTPADDQPLFKVMTIGNSPGLQDAAVQLASQQAKALSTGWSSGLFDRAGTDA